jgi:hypothetical protein
MTFTQYFNENKETLKDGHDEHVQESKQMGVKPMSLREWARKIYDSLKEQGEV